MSVTFVVKPATTVMLTGALVPSPPPSSVARALRLYVPARAFDQVKPNGLIVLVPNFVLFAKYSSLEIAPSGSTAFTVRLIGELATKTAPVAGLVNVTTGGRFEVFGG